MRIAYILTRADAVGGASIHVRDLSRAMAAQGHEVCVFIGGRGPVTDQLATPFHTLRYLQRTINPAKDLPAVTELVQALRDFRPDLISAHTAKAGWVGRAAAAKLRTPAVYTPHGLAVGDRISAWSGGLFTLAERFAARWSAAIVCVCEAERDLALAKNIAPAGKLHVIYNGVHDVDLRADPAAGEPVRIISVARFAPPKDHSTLLEALAGIRDLPWELDLIGDGPLEPRVRSAAAGFGGRIRFLGYQRDPAAALASAHLFVLSSHSEAFPRSILEAMRAGLPVVASNVGGVGEAVADGVTGQVVAPGSAEALAAAIKFFVSSRLERERAGREGRRRFEQSFRFERTAALTGALYAAILGR